MAHADMTASGLRFADYFDRIYVINLPSRPDRLASVRTELQRLGVTDLDRLLCVPEAPICDDAGGFPTKGVRGNFLSHLGILEDACDNGFERILVLEDDAIFRARFYGARFQHHVLSSVEAHAWSVWYAGHFLRTHPAGAPRPVYPSEPEFKWAHCYAVHRRGMEALRDYLRLVMSRPAGHPGGGKMYIDGAMAHFRMQFSDHTCLVSNPVLSIQKSSDTNLGDRQNPGHVGAVPWLVASMRSAKDALWRHTGIQVNVPRKWPERPPAPRAASPANNSRRSR